jgi:hypothetical protein
MAAIVSREILGYATCSLSRARHSSDIYIAYGDRGITRPSIILLVICLVCELPRCKSKRSYSSSLASYTPRGSAPHLIIYWMSPLWAKVVLECRWHEGCDPAVPFPGVACPIRLVA